MDGGSTSTRRIHLGVIITSLHRIMTSSEKNIYITAYKQTMDAMRPVVVHSWLKK